MQIIIDGKPAVLKEGSSFDYIAENRLFSGSDAYTLSITFPLRDCPGNIGIFGHAYRSDATVPKFVFDCEIRDKSFSKFGTLTIVETSETEVKAQFLEGRSEQNFAADFEKTYINELTLGSPQYTSPASVSPGQAWDPKTTGYQCVALPWVSADSGTTHNFADYNPDSGKYSWAAGVSGLSWQPYLLYVTKKICDAVGYGYDFSQWETDAHLKRLLICNVLPHTWDMPDFARILPHWTVDEYFEKLELLLAGEFDIDHRAKRITFAFSRSVLESTPPVRLDSVVDEFSSNVKTDGSDCDYLEAKNIAYKDPGHQMWKYYSCDWFLRQSNITTYTSLTALCQDFRAYRKAQDGVGVGIVMPWVAERVLYAEFEDMYFISRTISRRENRVGSVKYTYKVALQPINEFGPHIVNDDDDADSVEIEFVPACIDYTDDRYGFCIFCKFGSFSEESGLLSYDINDVLDQDTFRKTLMQSILEAGEQEERTEYYSVINIGHYDGYCKPGELPYPDVSSVRIDPDTYVTSQCDFSMSLNNSAHRAPVYDIDRTRRVTFKFLADTIPSPRALFYIKGKRYICEKITATFTESGMSQLMKGEFFPLLDN